MHKKAQPLHEFVRGDLVGYKFVSFLIDGQLCQQRIGDCRPAEQHGIYVQIFLWTFIGIEDGVGKA